MDGFVGETKAIDMALCASPPTRYVKAQFARGTHTVKMRGP